MMPRRRLLLVVVALVAAFATACGSGPATGDGASSDGGGAEVADGRLVLEFDGGELVGGVRREAIGLGDTIVISIVGELDDDIHVHGYDLYLRPAETDTLEFEALIPGRFEIELEQSGKLLMEITVS